MLQAGKLELSKHLIENAELQDLVFVLFMLWSRIFLLRSTPTPLGTVMEILCHMLEICDLPFDFTDSYILRCFAS